MVVAPLAASFILFDLVVHNPMHLETKRNLSLLGVAAGYFSRLEYASSGSLPSSPFSDFVQIAGRYVRGVDSGPAVGATRALHALSVSDLSLEVPSVPVCIPKSISLLMLYHVLTLPLLRAAMA